MLAGDYRWPSMIACAEAIWSRAAVSRPTWQFQNESTRHETHLMALHCTFRSESAVALKPWAAGEIKLRRANCNSQSISGCSSSVCRSIGRSIDQSIDQSMGRSIGRSISWIKFLSGCNDQAPLFSEQFSVNNRNRGVFSEETSLRNLLRLKFDNQITIFGQSVRSTLAELKWVFFNLK